MSPVSSRYIRAIYLLPGVKGGSEAKRAKGASKAAEKEDNCCRSRGTVWLFYCCLAVQPAVKVLGPSRAPRTKLKKCRAAQDLPRANSRVSHAKK